MVHTFYQMKIALFLVAALGVLPKAAAQPENLLADSAFFAGQVSVYQHWLDQAGFGKVLRAGPVRVSAPDTLLLYLTFSQQPDLETGINAWKSLQRTVDTLGALTLSERLFFRMLTVMGVEEGQARLFVQDQPEYPAYQQLIRFDTEEQRLVVWENNPKSEIRDLKIRFPALAAAQKNPALRTKTQLSKEAVFERVLTFARQKYGVSQCELRYPQVRPKPNADYLRFEVIDLCREVLPEEENPTICSWLHRLGYPCNWIKRELLVFHFVYIPNDDGYTLHLSLDGLVGSGYYENVRRDGYMDMHTDFSTELEAYADQIILELEQYLKHP